MEVIILFNWVNTVKLNTHSEEMKQQQKKKVKVFNIIDKRLGGVNNR